MARIFAPTSPEVTTREKQNMEQVRRIAAEKEEILAELKNTEDLSLRCSMPEWMVRFFLSFLDRETAEAFLKKHPEFTKRKERLFLQGIDPCDGFYYCLMEKQA